MMSEVYKDTKIEPKLTPLLETNRKLERQTIETRQR